MSINIGINEAARKNTARVLYRLLQLEFSLQQMTRAFHWNVEDPAFPTAHKIFADQYGQLSEIVDVLAERIRALGLPVRGSLSSLAEGSPDSGTGNSIVSAKTCYSMLLAEYETIIRTMRTELETLDAHDAVTANLIQDLIAQHEKTAWMLRASL